ncbi:MAG: hypothetical protein ACHQJ6_08320, partial [Candidatus Berkiellales bacterium]
SQRFQEKWPQYYGRIQQILAANGGRAPKITLLSAGNGMIKYHLLVAKEELSRVFPVDQQQRYTITPRGVAGSYQFERKNLYHYFRYQLKLSLQHSLYADPHCDFNLVPERNIIYRHAPATYTDQQYATLQALFSGDPAVLNRLGLSQEWIDFLNQKACAGNPWNWLKEETNRSYIFDRLRLIPPPWFRNDSRVEVLNYRLFELVHDFSDHPQLKKLNRFPGWIEKAISFFPLLVIVFCISPIAQMAPYFYTYAFFSTIFSGAFELALRFIAKASQPLPSRTFDPLEPKWLMTYYAQIFMPFKRTLLNPVAEHYPEDTKQRLKTLYPLRVLAGSILFLCNSVTFATEKAVMGSIYYFLTAYYTAANLWFDYREQFSKLKDWLSPYFQKWTKKRKGSDDAKIVPKQQHPLIPVPVQTASSRGSGSTAMLTKYKGTTSQQSPKKAQDKRDRKAEGKTDDKAEGKTQDKTHKNDASNSSSIKKKK